MRCGCEACCRLQRAARLDLGIIHCCGEFESSCGRALAGFVRKAMGTIAGWLGRGSQIGKDLTFRDFSDTIERVSQSIFTAQPPPQRPIQCHPFHSSETQIIAFHTMHPMPSQPTTVQYQSAHIPMKCTYDTLVASTKTNFPQPSQFVCKLTPLFPY
jgi:hypothetical protein